MTNKAHILQQILDNRTDNKKVFGTSFSIRHKEHIWYGASGNLTTESSYFIASTTKLYTTAIILHFQSKGLLKLDDLILHYLDEHIITGLNRHKGVDYSNKITIKQLLAHTSGIPDYFQGKNELGISLEHQLMKNTDQAWSFEDAIMRAKTISSSFSAGTSGKALYSDTNFQLLGKIIEKTSGKTLEENYSEFIYTPLQLTKTYLYQDPNDKIPATLFYKHSPLDIPLAMSSFGPDGGMVSTSDELLQFLYHFFNGTFFEKSTLKELQVWNRIFFPMKSGVGIHQFKLPRFFDPLGIMPELIGHSGLSGALAYYSPQHDLYIAGTVNQVAYPDTSFKLMTKLIRTMLKK